jgi:hypothetical protein
LVIAAAVDWVQVQSVDQKGGVDQVLVEVFLAYEGQEQEVVGEVVVKVVSYFATVVSGVLYCLTAG